ncbi:MAG TPA: hypothetical protein VGN32_11675, partial [Ktedonobacterales bacterium]|nr:hypothetical protein [Ktedonobacterales bacterium]
MRVLRFLIPLLFLIGFAIPAAGVAAGAAHAAAAPSITLDPNAVQFDVATTVTATGAGFTPQSGVQIRIDKQPAIGGATAGAGGAFSSKLTVPVLTLGRHAISATDSIGLTASQPLYAVNVILSTKTPRQGESIVISGAGFYPSQQLVIYLANQAVRTLTTDASGSFQNQSIVVPASAAGQVTLRLVSGANPAIEYDTILTIPMQAATLSISPASTVSGGLVAVTGSGFTAGERVDVTLNNAAAGAATATAAGQMSLAFSVPRTLAPGTYTL